MVDRWPAEDLDRLGAIVGKIAQATRTDRPAPKALTEATATATLANVAATIREAVLGEFRHRKREQLLRLQDGVRVSGVPLATLSICGRGTREIRFTQLLRYILDRTAPHGLGHAALAASLEGTCAALRPTDSDWAAASTRAEVPFGGPRPGSFDLVVTMPRFDVLIEHKILSKEGRTRAGTGPSQLREYREAFTAASMGRPFVCVYLTPSGVVPKSAVGWQGLSHRDVVASLVGVLHQPGLSDMGAFNLASVAWDLIGGPLNIEPSLLEELTRRIDAACADEIHYLSLRRWAEDRMPLFDLLLDIQGVLHDRTSH